MRGEQPARYAADLSGNGQNDDWVIEYAWNPQIPLSPPAPNYSGPIFRGGFRAQILDDTNRNFNTNQYGNSTTSIRMTPVTGKVSRVSGVFFFDKEDMEGIQPEDTLSFDAGSYLKVSSSEPGLFGARWLVRDGTQYYVSEEVIDGSVRSHMTSIPGSLDHGRWAVYNVDATMQFNPGSATFETRVFSDITAIGFIVNKEQYDNASIWIRWNGFEANMTVNGVPNQRPVAVMQTDYTNAAKPPFTLQVDSSNSYDPDGNIVFSNWQPGGNSPAVGGQTAALQYLAAGSYQVVLTVWDDRLESDSASLWIDVVSPVADNPSLVVASWGGDVVDSNVNFRNFNGSQWTVTGQAYDFMNGYEFSATNPLTTGAVRGTRLFGGMLAKSQNTAAGFNERRFENANPWDGINIRHSPTAARPAQWHGVFFIDKSDFVGEGRDSTFSFRAGARMVLDGIYAFTRVGDVRFLVRDGNLWYVSQKVLTQSDSSFEIPSDTNHGNWAQF
ncbi:MAG: PKD domain-containing protein [Verrucomicrobia bacterium]|nr:PKD domain-containing protein [Verrucomicrobiota bacterium]